MKYITHIFKYYAHNWYSELSYFWTKYLPRCKKTNGITEYRHLNGIPIIVMSVKFEGLNCTTKHWWSEYLETVFLPGQTGVPCFATDCPHRTDCTFLIFVLHWCQSLPWVMFCQRLSPADLYSSSIDWLAVRFWNWLIKECRRVVGLIPSRAIHIKMYAHTVVNHFG